MDNFRRSLYLYPNHQALEMIATIPYVKEKFREFNETIFQNTLPDITIKMTSLQNTIGAFRYRKRPDGRGKWTLHDYSLRINNRYDIPQDEIDDTIIHEMIHYYIHYHKINDDGAHGKVFCRIMNQINQQFGRNIGIMHKSADGQPLKDTKRRLHLICISTFEDNTFGITVSAQTCVFKLWDMIATIPSVVSTTWYVSRDPYFNKYPHVRSLKVYRVNEQDLHEHIRNAFKLQRFGNEIRAVGDENIE